jgi:hypothetical protein
MQEMDRVTVTLLVLREAITPLLQRLVPDFTRWAPQHRSEGSLITASPLASNRAIAMCPKRWLVCCETRFTVSPCFLNAIDLIWS